jgi:hypothetical protein
VAALKHPLEEGILVRAARGVRDGVAAVRASDGFEQSAVS